MEKIIRIKEALSRSGKGRTSFYEDIKDGRWTRPVSIGARSVGWPEHEVDAIVGALISEAGDDAVRHLVTGFHDARAEARKAVGGSTARAATAAARNPR